MKREAKPQPNKIIDYGTDHNNNKREWPFSQWANMNALTGA